MDGSPAGSFAHGILQARILERVAFPPPENLSSSGIKTHISCVSCIGRQILYHWAIWEVQSEKNTLLIVVVQSLSYIWLSETSWIAASQASLSFTVSWSLLNSYPMSQWCCLTISSSFALFSFCLQSFPASGSFPMSWLFASGGQSIEAWAWAWAVVLPMNIQGWFLLGLTGLISLLSKGLSRVYSSTLIL